MNYCKKSDLLFETIKILDFRPQNLKFHIKRAEASADEALKFDLESCLDSPLAGLVRAKVIYDRGGNLKSVEYFAYEMRKFYEFRLVDVDFSYEKKFLDRSDIDAAKGAFSEIVMIKNGLVTDTSIANLAIFNDGWITPKSPLLRGTTRARLLEEGFLRQEDISVQRLLEAKRFGVMNAMMGFLELNEFKFTR